MSNAEKRALVPLADGFEEIEAITIIDVLRRGGIRVDTAFLKEQNVNGSHGIRVTADIDINSLTSADYDAVVLPGGMPGSENLAGDHRVISIIKSADEKKKLIGAVCAAPMVLGKAGVLKGRRAVCYPGYEGRLDGAILVNEPVVADGHLVTGKGAGAAIAFALKIVEILSGPEISRRLSENMQVYWM